MRRTGNHNKSRLEGIRRETCRVTEEELSHLSEMAAQTSSSTAGGAAASSGREEDSLQAASAMWVAAQGRGEAS